MNEFFGSRRLTVSEDQLTQLDHVQLSETARSLLDKAKIPASIQIPDSNLTTVQESIRDLARNLFIKLN